MPETETDRIDRESMAADLQRREEVKEQRLAEAIAAIRLPTRRSEEEVPATEHAVALDDQPLD